MIIVPELQREVLVVSGTEARSWLNGLVTCDVSTVDRHRGAYGLLLTKQGKIQSDLEVMAGDSGVLLAVAPGTGELVRSTLDRYLVMEDAELELRPELAVVRIVGEGSDRVAGALREELTSVPAAGSIDWLGQGGAAFVVDRASVARVTRELVERAGGDASLGGPEAWGRLRVPRGFPEFGVDYSSEDNPHEAALDRLAVSFTKGCYLGQEVVCMQDMRGRLKRRIVALRFPDAAGAVGGAISPNVSVSASGVEEPAGRLTSVAAEGPDGFALARLRAPFFLGGAELTVAGIPAEIVARASGE